MGTFTDNFTGGYDSAFWDEYKSTAAIVIGQVNNQIEMSYVLGSNWQEGGLISKVTYDFTAPANVQTVPTKITTTNTRAPGNILYVCPTVESMPEAGADFYRFCLRDVGTRTSFAQRKVSGTQTTLWSGTPATTGLLGEIDFPSTGDDVRFIIDGVEVGSDATFAIPSRINYWYVGAFFDRDAGTKEVDFDNVQMTSDYTAPGGGTIPKGSLCLMGVGI